MFFKWPALLFVIIILNFYFISVKSDINITTNKFSSLNSNYKYTTDNSYNAKDNNNNNESSDSSNNSNNNSSGGDNSDDSPTKTVQEPTENSLAPPHIIFILADDLGFNDVGFRGSSEIPTPNIDALAFSGIILNRYYVNPICTPSRSALMTGKYPIHTGMQHTVLYGAEPRGLPLNEKLMPQYFNDLGYSSHIAGKWHLGHYKRVYTPLFRGFRTHVGYWTGHHDYFDHTAVESQQWGLDLRDGLDVGYDLHGKYTTDLVTEESLRVIANHNASSPLFLYVSHAAVHSGNPYNPLPAPDEAVAKLQHIGNYNRRKYAAMVTKLDDSVGRIVQQLQKQKMLNDSIIIFSTDNGGPAEGFNLNHASNWPLRGVKNTLWEGGIRGAGLIWSPRLKNTRRVADQTIHIADWLPTLLTAIKGETYKDNISQQLDGLSIWQALSNDETSPRRSTLHNIDDIWGSSALTEGDWKVVKGTNYKGAWDGWYGPAGNRDARSYDYKAVRSCYAGRALATLNMLPTPADITRMRSESNIDCTARRPYLKQGTVCKPLVKPCLFNIRDDPCEIYNLAQKYPNILEALLEELDNYNATAVPPSNLPLDPRANPSRWNYTWTNFGDYEEYQKSYMLIGDF
ncbi:arylsulfatase B [Lucilia cuprina]|uniref:arylsulfatase B n=1 Tax=Lucilia cuprina TaxID=7375 RepID=UPI001F068F88|nr:arylsulfatase B [Lucilia cuprina]